MQENSTVQSSIDIRDNIECKVKWFNTSKGFGFVEPLGEKEAKVALSNLHETKIANNKIRVKLAQ